MTGSTTKINKIQRSTNTKIQKVVLKKQPAPKTTRNNGEKKVGKKNNKEQVDDILHHCRQIKFSEEFPRRMKEGIKKGIEELTENINKRMREVIKKGFEELAEDIKKGIQMHIALQETKELESDIDKTVAMDTAGSDINISG